MNKPDPEDRSVKPPIGLRAKMKGKCPRGHKGYLRLTKIVPSGNGTVYILACQVRDCGAELTHRVG